MLINNNSCDKIGSKHIKNFEEKFLEKGLIPLESIIDAKHKVACIDKEGYKYKLSYHGGVSDKRTKAFDKWDRNNPFKPYNMRLYASRVQENCVILSTDEELRESARNRLRFVCPSCGEEFTKRWYHWINMPFNHHVCPKCNKNPISAGISQYTLLTEQWLKDNHIKYDKEYVFDDCKYKNVLRFDFCVKDWNGKMVLIEVDGMQHFYTSTWTTQERLEETQLRDKIKDEYCKSHNLTLVRIPYWLYRHTTYKDILKQTFFG